MKWIRRREFISFSVFPPTTTFPFPQLGILWRFGKVSYESRGEWTANAADVRSRVVCRGSSRTSQWRTLINSPLLPSSLPLSPPTTRCCCCCRCCYLGYDSSGAPALTLFRYILPRMSADAEGSEQTSCGNLEESSTTIYHSAASIIRQTNERTSEFRI